MNPKLVNFSLEFSANSADIRRIRSMRVGPLNDPERAPKSWGFFLSRCSFRHVSDHFADVGKMVDLGSAKLAQTAALRSQSVILKKRVVFTPDLIHGQKVAQ